MKKIYVCNDTITGIFSAIYDAWKEGREEKECGIAIKGMLEQELFCEYILGEENLHKEQAVERLIRKHLGGQAYADIWHASLASDKDKADAIYGTMLAARRLRDSKKVMEHLSHPQVERVFELSRKVGSEAHNYKGFLRFRELSGGILYGGIAPHTLSSIMLDPMCFVFCAMSAVLMQDLPLSPSQKALQSSSNFSL